MMGYFNVCERVSDWTHARAARDRHAHNVRASLFVSRGREDHTVAHVAAATRSHSFTASAASQAPAHHATHMDAPKQRLQHTRVRRECSDDP